VRLLAVVLFVALLAALPPPAVAAGGAGITVAVLDSGVDGSHPELAGRVDRKSFDPFVIGVPGVPLDPSAAQPDPNGQGTAVASLVAGATLGVAPQARILDLQVSARYTGTNVDPVAEQAAISAMDYLLQDPHKAQVVVMSFASRGVSAVGAHTLAEQANGLRKAGVLVVVPMASSDSELQSSPSSVTVGAPGTNCPDAGPGQARKPDLVANSERLTAAAPGNAAMAGGKTTVSGTAFAAAQVAGAAALMLGERHDLPVDAEAAILRDTAAPGAPCDGFGLLAPQAAAAAAVGWTDPLGDSAKPAPGLAAPLLAVAVLAVAAVSRRKA
jgi:subtilisin family serine protease